MTRRSPAERTLDAEVRAVEEGHHARLTGDGRRFSVKSDVADWTYHVRIVAVGGTVVFECDHVRRFDADAQPERTFVPCKHGALCARRLARQGILRWESGRWLPTAQALAGAGSSQSGDPFDGLPS
jgi:hypothetical protein